MLQTNFLVFPFVLLQMARSINQGLLGKIFVFPCCSLILSSAELRCILNTKPELFSYYSSVSSLRWAPFSSCPQSFPASGYPQRSYLRKQIYTQVTELNPNDPSHSAVMFGKRKPPCELGSQGGLLERGRTWLLRRICIGRSLGNGQTRTPLCR